VSGGGNANFSASVRGASWLARAFSFSRSVSSSRLSRAEQSIRRGASWAPNRREEEEEEEEGEEAAGGGDGKDETEGSAARLDPWAAAAAARPGELLSDEAAVSIVAADAGLLGPPGSREGSGGRREGASWWNEMTEHEVRGGAGALAALGAAAAATAEGNERSGSGKSRDSGGRA
jgi:hypothetical protein